MSRNKRWQVRIFFFGWLIFLALFIRNTRFGFLLLNTILAYIPIEISFHIGVAKKENNILFWVFTVLWMLFYPNAPYIMTDLIHLGWLYPDKANGLLRISPNVWFLFTCLIISALVSAFIGFWSLLHVSKALCKKLHLDNHLFLFLMIVFLTVLTSIGLYIGRFLRVHTVYLFIAPATYLKSFTTMWTTNMLIFVVLMTIIQLVIYWIYTIMSNND